jgi:hypothetical protein
VVDVGKKLSEFKLRGENSVSPSDKRKRKSSFQKHERQNEKGFPAVETTAPCGGKA